MDILGVVWRYGRGRDREEGKKGVVMYSCVYCVIAVWGRAGRWYNQYYIIPEGGGIFVFCLWD